MMITKSEIENQEFQAENKLNINAFFIHPLSKKKKLAVDVRKFLNTCNCHWNDDKTAFSGPQGSKIIVETFLKNRGINFSIEDGYDPFFDLSPNQQKQERLSSVKDIKTINGLEVIANFQPLLKEYNHRWNANLKANDFHSKSLEELCKGLETDNEIKYVEFLF